MTTKHHSLIFIISLMLAPLLHAETAEEKGLAIAQEADARNTGWGNSRAHSTMTLKNKQGETSIRKTSTETLEVDGDGDKSLTYFHEPKDVEGTTFLSFSHATKPDEQWIYLPALKRVKRISSSNKSGPFMGSEFAFEDLSSFEIEKYTYKYLTEEPCGEQMCFVVEMKPEYKNSGYKRIVNKIDQEHYRMMESKFYDRKNSELKTLTYSDYKLYKDKYWRALVMEVVNTQTGKSTRLVFDGYEFDVADLDENDFHKNKLKRRR